MISAADISRLRRETGYGVMDIKRALTEAKGDETAALELLKAAGVERSSGRADRAAEQGLIEAYVHQGRIGVLVEVNSETDFVARSTAFKEFAHKVAMQISATAPADLAALLAEPSIHDASQTVQSLLDALAGVTGEKIAIRRFSRFALGGL